MVTLDSVRKDAPWQWLKDGASDMLAAPVVSLGYGVMFTLVGIAITLGMWAAGLGGFIPVMIGGFALVAPTFAIGIYRISQARDAGETPGLLDFWKISGSKLTQLGLLSVLLFVFFLAWARLAQFLFAMLAGTDSDFRIATLQNFLFTDPSGVLLLVIGTAVGAALALVAFAVSAISFPMLVDQDVDAITAVVASVKAVTSNPFTMLTWALIIAGAVAVGAAGFLIGLAVSFPLIAHASWRAYKDFNPKPLPSAAELEARDA
jgi:uncharacterized membrane protein